LHGPITTQDNIGSPDLEVLYLRRGRVSGGCNRMMGEHVLEIGHVLGLANMRRVYQPNKTYAPETPVRVKVIDEYDSFAGKAIDVDYPTDVGAIRPAVSKGADKVEMFGSWVASETPNGRDLPPNMAWEGGVTGKAYVFNEHARRGWVCSMPKDVLPKLATWAATQPNREVPASVCGKTRCVADALRAGANPTTVCAL
jgi:hypothetical protein